MAKAGVVADRLWFVGGEYVSADGDLLPESGFAGLVDLDVAVCWSFTLVPGIAGSYSWSKR